MFISRMVNHDFFTSNGGFKRWTSISGASTEMGSGIFIINDPLKPEDVLSEVKRRAQ